MCRITKRQDILNAENAGSAQPRKKGGLYCDRLYSCIDPQEGLEPLIESGARR